MNGDVKVVAPVPPVGVMGIPVGVIPLIPTPVIPCVNRPCAVARAGVCSVELNAVAVYDSPYGVCVFVGCCGYY